jgi:hypothetical protein
MVDWASLTRFITLSSSLAAAWAVSSGGFTMALLEWLILEGKGRMKRNMLAQI